MVRAQPSTRTKRRSLNGIDTMVGDSIIMPSAIKVEATTRSMMRKGRKIRKPIWNAVLSSLVTKAGSRIEKGTSAGLANGCAWARSANNLRSDWRGWGGLKTGGDGAARPAPFLAPDPPPPAGRWGLGGDLAS